jgi:aminoglycoside 6'-N-acetyltransferase
MRQWIIEFDRRSFAYAQDYDAHAWPQAHLADLPLGAKVVDVFIGDPQMVGGQGKAFLGLLARKLLDDGAPLVAIDLIAENHRARRAYAAAGFSEEAVVETEAGPAVLMLYRKTL